MNDHPDDVAARVALHQAIRQARVDVGMSQRDLARRLGLAQSAVPCFEAHTSHLVGVAQRYARGVGQQLTLHLHDLPPVVDGTVMTYHQLAATSPDPKLADAYHRAAVLETLRVIRLDGGRPTRTVSSAMGCGEDALLQLEAGRDDIRLSTLQRYTRTLGGWLGWELAPSGGGQ